MTETPFDPAAVLAALRQADVQFVLIGGMAAVLHGDVGVTVDVDITPAYDPDNLEKLATALRALDARIRADGAPQGLPFECSTGFLRNLGPDAILNLTTRAGDLDVSFTPAGTRGYRDLKRDAVAVDAAAGVSILVASLADIIRSKSAADREKDRRALPRLHELLERTSGERIERETEPVQGGGAPPPRTGPARNSPTGRESGPAGRPGSAASAVGNGRPPGGDRPLNVGIDTRRPAR